MMRIVLVIGSGSDEVVYLDTFLEKFEGFVMVEALTKGWMQNK